MSLRLSRIFWFSCFVFCIGVGAVARAEEAAPRSLSRSKDAPYADDGARLTYCAFGPKVKVFSEKIGSDGCTGTAQVQGLQWGCVRPSEIDGKTADFRRQLEREAKSECESICASRRKGCRAIWIAPRKCALMISGGDALETGRRLGCAVTCSGQALAYCSIYNSGFILNDPELMSDQPPNCRCAPLR